MHRIKCVCWRFTKHVVLRLGLRIVSFHDKLVILQYILKTIRDSQAFKYKMVGKGGKIGSHSLNSLNIHRRRENISIFSGKSSVILTRTTSKFSDNDHYFCNSVLTDKNITPC